MGQDFDFFNDTTGEGYDPQSKSGDPYLWRKIDQFSWSHLKQVILKVIEINEWDYSDKIIITGDCGSSYIFEDGILYRYLGDIINTDFTICANKRPLDCSDDCDLEECPICNESDYVIK